MWDQDSRIEPTVYRLNQQSGPVAVQALRRSERDWPLTLEDCQRELVQGLSRLRSHRGSRREYWHWVGLTRTEMLRLFEDHRMNCRERQSWDLPALVRLRCRLELVTLRLCFAPWSPKRAESSVVNLDQFIHLTA